MSMHNNLSSTLPFIPSSTSILTAPPAASSAHQLPNRQQQHHSAKKQGVTGSSPASAGQAWQQQPSQPSLHRKQLIPMRTNSVQKSQQSVQVPPRQPNKIILVFVTVEQKLYRNFTIRANFFIVDVSELTFFRTLALPYGYKSLMCRSLIDFWNRC